MLVLTRKIDEQIKIGDDITITIIKLRNNQIRIGIDAPRDVRVLRGELEAIKPAASEIRNDVVDGLMSADEMIARGKSNEGKANHAADENVAVEANAKVEADADKVQIISGKIRKPNDRVTTMRAPLSDFFSAT